MNRSIFQIWQPSIIKDENTYKKNSFLNSFLIFSILIVFFLFFFKKNVFCFNIEEKVLKKIIINNFDLYISNFINLNNLNTSLNNFKNFALNYNYDFDKNYFNWNYLEHVNFKKKSFFDHPCLIYYDQETNYLIFKYYTKNPDISRNYDFLYQYLNNKNKEINQFVSSEYSVISLKEVLIKTVTNTQYLDQFEHKLHISNYLKNIKNYKI